MGMMNWHVASVAPILLIHSGLIFIVFSMLKLYRSVGLHPVIELERVVTATAIVYLGLLAVAAWSSVNDLAITLIWISVAGLGGCFAMPIGRHLLRRQLGKTTWWRSSMVLIGKPKSFESLWKEF